MSEEWRPIPGFEGSYEVSSTGRVRSIDRKVEYSNGRFALHRGRIIKASDNGTGYMKVCLSRGPRKASRYVHLCVAEAFMGSRPEGLEVCHNNGDTMDNRIENLRYDSASGNRLDKRIHGTNFESNKTHCPNGHAHSPENNMPCMEKRGKRSCLACSRARSNLRSKGMNIRDHADVYKKISDSHYAAIVASEPKGTP